MKKTIHWILDYIYAVYILLKISIIRKEPKHYRGYIEKKTAILLIPGILERWGFLRYFANTLSGEGYPIYTLTGLGYNTKSIHDSAKMVQEFIKEKNLKKVIILAHSKGGIIGREVLSSYNQDGRIIKLIAIASPFRGSKISRAIPFRPFKELTPKSVAKISPKNSDADDKIVSICGYFDNHIWPNNSCELPGAENIEVDIYGHHKILANKKVLKIVKEKIKEAAGE
ncbi:MAG: alpha/beta hydrolase [Candidatus Spechtbacterales bacterium]|nr:alpha/beta hydrolase [Candidatus Spechtbacterales bacterium]